MRTVRAPRGTDISCRAWPQEAALRMLMNNLDPEVAERPDDLITMNAEAATGTNLADIAKKWLAGAGINGS